MARYPFTDVEQDVIRELGRLGFRYIRETKKTIEFEGMTPHQVIELNREHSMVALVVNFGDPFKAMEVPGVLKIGSRASSNFSGLAKGLTSTGKENHLGTQIVARSPDAIPSIIERLT